ncbi:hypothetical protein JCM21900_003572 [Sporobolomyces salmonicolor]
MNGSYTLPSAFDGSSHSWAVMAPDYYTGAHYDHLHHPHQVAAAAPLSVPQQQPVAHAYASQPHPDGRHFAAGYTAQGYPYLQPQQQFYAQQQQQQQQAYAVEQPARSRFAFAATTPATHYEHFALPPPAYSYAAAYPGAEEQARSHSRERSGWEAGAYGRAESGQRATLQGEQQLHFLLGRLAQNIADLTSSRSSAPDDYDHPSHSRPPHRFDVAVAAIVPAPAHHEDDPTITYDLIPNTSTVPPPPPVERSAVPLADLATEMVWEACRQGFLLASHGSDSDVASASHLAGWPVRTTRRSRESFGNIGEGRSRQASADGFLSEASSFMPGTPVEDVAARRDRLASLGLADSAHGHSLKMSTSASYQSSAFPVEPSTAFRQFVKQILTATLVTPEDIVLALYYVAQIALQDIIPPTPAEGGQDAQTTSFKAAPFKIVLGALMLANKTLQDNSYRNETFATVSGIPLKDVNALEIYAFSALKFDVALREDKWVAWLQVVAARVMTGRGELGDRLAVEDALNRLARSVHRHVASPLPSSPVLGAAPMSSIAPATPMAASSVYLEDINLDASGPLESPMRMRRVPTGAVRPPRVRQQLQAQDSPLLSVAAARAGRSLGDVGSLFPPVDLAATRSRSFGQEIHVRAVC